MKIIVLDTETTGMMEKDRICQLSYLVLNEEFEIEEIHNDLCMPPLPIAFEAMAIHHITPEMLEGEPSCVQTKAYKRLCELNIPSNIIVIQNAAFDLGMLSKEGFTSQMNLIDTFRILRAYYPQDGSSFSLQYKRYQWGLYSILHALEATKENVTLTISFGKYAGKTPEEVLEIDRNYLLWMVNKMDNLNAELKEAIEKVLVAYP